MTDTDSAIAYVTNEKWDANPDDILSVSDSDTPFQFWVDYASLPEAAK